MSEHDCPNPNCNNQGFYPVGDPDDPDMEQCQWCYTMPESVFNLKCEIDRLQDEVHFHQRKTDNLYALFAYAEDDPDVLEMTGGAALIAWLSEREEGHYQEEQR